MLDQRLVCFYTDDTGQQTRGRYFLLAGIAISHERGAISAALEAAETNSHKHQADWHSAHMGRRIDYLRRAFDIGHLQGRIFYRVCRNAPSSQYIELRTDALQAAIGCFAPKNQRAMLHEGLTRTNRDSLCHALRRRGLPCEVRNAKFLRYPELRLADALAGMIAKVQFSTDGADYKHLMKDWFVEL